MRVFVGSVLGFIAGAVASYIALMVGYSVYIDLFKIHDHDGGGAMAIGPVVALLCGIVTAVVFGMWVAQRR
jgi:hypothetical protein